MGYWHSTVRPSAMGGGYLLCQVANFTDDELRVARVLYSRPVGNVDPDKDPPGFSFITVGASGPRIETCDRFLTR